MINDPRLMPLAQKRLILLGALVSLFLAALDQTIVSTATPAIVRDLAFPTSWITWLTTAFLVLSTATLPIWGKLSDLYGRRNILVTGLLLFCFASVLCALAFSPLSMVLFRALQGIGSAAILSTVFALVSDIFTPQERPRYQGLFGSVFAVSSVIGPWVGGILTDMASWHWVFLVNVPILALVLPFILKKMPPLRHRNSGSIDFTGAVLLLATVIPLLLIFALAPARYAWISVPVLIMVAIVLLALTAFIVHERRTDEPIIDLMLFADKSFRLMALGAFFTGGAFLCAIVFIPLYMVNVYDFSATRAGVTVMPLTFGLVAANVASGRLASHIGSYKPVLIPALSFAVVSLLAVSLTLNVGQPHWSISVRLFLVGLGLGPSIPMLTQMMINSVNRQKIGMVSSTAAFVRQLGNTVGLAVFGTILTSILTVGMGIGGASVLGQTDTAHLSIETGASVTSHFDADKMIATAKKQYAHLSSRIQNRQTLTTADLQLLGVEPEVLATMDAAALNAQIHLRLEQTETQIFEVAQTFKATWTKAVKTIFLTAMVMVLCGLVAVILIPEIPFKELEQRRE
ncbi:MDR family MFS transporter [Gynuella sunshinyii]|uniref:Arabinose efflux permease n=1 Tax=Gynuella sunshinyii YC6258 TaxID=1445510 RepID=A0A0C5VI76_9GAMM|nr:MDR family MFS transporter [Gynuella sunshinyii]AJQ93063.1 arabinose efflux permease [Gynuella sunshinyii YC6258]